MIFRGRVVRFVAGAVLSLAGLAIPATGEAYVYWTNGGGTIGRANIDGSGATSSFLLTGGNPAGIASNGVHLFWTDLATGNISRVGVDSAGADPDFVTGGSFPRGVAVNATHLFWANETTESIGRASIGGGPAGPQASSRAPATRPAAIPMASR